MSSQRPIALVGFSSTEQILLEGVLFQPGVNQIPGAFQEHDLARAELIIASADDAVAVRALQARALPGRVLLIGATDAGTGWPVVARPLRLHPVLEAVRRLLPAPASGGLRRPQEATSGFAATQPFVPLSATGMAGFEPTRQFEQSDFPTPFEATRPFARPHGLPQAGGASPGVPVPSRSTPQFEDTQPFDPAHEGQSAFKPTKPFDRATSSVVPPEWAQEVAARAGRTMQRQPEVAAPQDHAAESAAVAPPVVSAAPGMPASPSTGESEVPSDFAAVMEPAVEDRIMVVGHSGVAASGLLKIFQSAGFPVDFAPDRQTVFRYLALRPYRFVFLIEVSLGPEAIALCRAIQDNRGVSPEDPKLVIVASHRGLLSRVRAWFAGCNAWMAIPLNRMALLQYLLQHGAEGSAGR